MAIRRGLRLATALGVLLAGVTASAGAGPAPGTDRPGAVQPGAVQPVAEQGQTPAALARATGRRVEDQAQRTETREVYANPDGTFTAELHAQPVRARGAGGWVPVDVRLGVSSTGTVEPAAVPLPLSFSGGGATQPLVAYGAEGRRVELRWPGPLPAPHLKADTATYPEVLPGIDLTLRAGAEGFSQMLVVKTRAAAARLTSVDYGLSATGLTVTADARGVLQARDAMGTVVFQSPPPQMWDATGERTAVGAVSLGRDRLTVVPDRALLDDPAAAYPISIDPDFSPGQTGWTKVFSGKPGNSYWNGGVDGPEAKAGLCNFSGCNGIGLTRSYFQYDTGFLGGRHVTGAEFNAFETRAPSCAPAEIQLWRTNPVDAGTTWNAQPGGWSHQWSNTVAYGYSASCPANWVGFVASANAGGLTTFLLKAGDEGNSAGWKKFNNNPSLIVHYNTPPGTPGALTANNAACGVEPNEPWLASATPTLRAVVSDPEGGLVQADFEWYVRRGGLVGSTRVAAQSSGTTFAATIPAGHFADGAKIAFRVRGWDGTDFGPWSAWCDVSVDLTAPAVAPAVSSVKYPENQLGGGIGQTGTFTFSSTEPGLAGFRYDLHDQPSTFVAAVNGSATVGITPPTDGPMDLYVRSVDRAGNLGPIYRSFTNPPTGGYHFLVGAGTGPVGRWRMDGWGSATEVPDSSGRGHAGTRAGGTSWTTGRVDDGLLFDGGSGYVSTTGGPAVRTDATFSVAAWVRLDRVDSGFYTAVSQDGGVSSGFYFGYTGDSRRFAFRMLPGDNLTTDTIRANAPSAPSPGVWTHLVGVYDRGSGQLRLYVDGVAAGTAVLTTPWNATGAVQLGRAKYNGYVNNWPGAIDDVRIYDRALSAGEIHDLATLPANEEAFLPLDEGTGSTAADASGNNRFATLGAGATWVPGRVGPSAVHVSGGAAVTTGSAAVRTDGSFTVTASVKLDAANGVDQVALSQDGAHASGFVLQYHVDGRRWQFALAPSDVDAPAWVQAYSTSNAFAEWTHLAGVYDAAAREVRIYVNGTLEGRTPIPAGTAISTIAGPLVIGRAKYLSAPQQPWSGAVDDVHVWTGVRTDDQLRAEFLDPVVDRQTPFTYAGQLGRYVDHTGHHFVTTGPAPRGAHYEGPMGLLAPPGAPDTRELYSCLYGGGQYTSIEPGCEGFTRLGLLGRVYRNPPAGVPSLPIYRCVVTTGDHFVSHNADCEGARTEGLQGYTRGYAPLIRYAQPDAPFDRWSSRYNTAASYRPEVALGLTLSTWSPDITGLFACRDGADVFSSTDPACEGRTVIDWSGQVWTSPPVGVQSWVRLFACRATDTGTGTGERFDSLDPACDGGTLDHPLGYLITEL